MTSADYLVGGLEHHIYFSIQLGMSSSQLTNSYFSEGLVETTNQYHITIILFIYFNYHYHITILLPHYHHYYYHNYYHQPVPMMSTVPRGCLHHGVISARILWNSMTNALAKGAQWLRALSSLSSLSDVVTPDVVTVGAALQALEQGRAVGLEYGQGLFDGACHEGMLHHYIYIYICT